MSALMFMPLCKGEGAAARRQGETGETGNGASESERAEVEVFSQKESKQAEAILF